MTKTSSSADHPHYGHLHLIGVLLDRVSPGHLYGKPVRLEAEHELDRYRDNGLIIQKFGKDRDMTKKTRAHSSLAPEAFTGQGIMFVVVDDRELMPEGRSTTIDVIADGIEAALDAGQETSEEIARYLTTSAFQHIPDRRIRFNAVLKASDAVGAQMTRKLYNAYNELAQLADDEPDPKKKAAIKAEARGFAEALNVVISPFSCEDPADPRLVNWDEVDRITETFEKEQRFVRRERKGTPQ